MSYANFKPTIWSKYIQHELPKFTVFENDCDYKFEGEVKQGKTVKILGVGRPTIGSYTGAAIGSPEAVSTNDTTLAIDQAKFFNFAVDDVDKAQSIDGLMSALMEESTRAMAESRDTYIAGLAAAATNVSASTAITSKTTAKAAIDAAITALMGNGVSMSRDSVTMYLSPAVFMLFADYILEAKTQNDKAIASGVIGNYMGAAVKMTNNVYNDGTDNYLMVKTSKAIAFCSCIDSVEAYRPEDLFSDAVKGLNTFGGKIVRPNELYVIKAH